MMATSFIVEVSFRWRCRQSYEESDGLEGERNDLVALVIGGQRHHGQLDVHAELELGRVILGQPAFDADHVLELHQADAERDEVLTDRALIRRAGREALRRPRDEGATPGQQHVRHLPGAALGAALLDGKGGGSALAAGASNEVGILVGPGRDLRRERYLLCRHTVDDNRKWRSRLERTGAVVQPAAGLGRLCAWRR